MRGLIVNGMQSARPGAKVIPHEVRFPPSRWTSIAAAPPITPDTARHADACKSDSQPSVEGAPVKIAHFFIDRPVFAIVLSLVTIIAGSIAVSTLPIAQYPQIAPPTVTVSRYLPGRQRRNRREDRRHADRRTDQRRREHALHVQPVDQHREPEPDGDVQGRHEPRRRPGAGAEPGGHRPAAASAGGAAAGNHREEGVAGHYAGDRVLLARRRRTTRCSSATT